MVDETEDTNQVVFAAADGNSHTSVLIHLTDRISSGGSGSFSTLGSGVGAMPKSTVVTSQPAWATAKEKVPEPTPRSNIFPHVKWVGKGNRRFPLPTYLLYPASVQSLRNTYDQRCISPERPYEHLQQHAIRCLARPHGRLKTHGKDETALARSTVVC